MWKFDKSVSYVYHMEDVPRVTVIGTCRVDHPLRNLEQREKIILNNGGLGSFVHSSPEALLRLRVLLGLEAYDEQFVKLQVGEAKDLKLTPDDEYEFSDTDLLVVELSTIKALSLLGQPLQFNEVNRHMCTPYGEFGKAIRKNLNVAFNTRASSVELPEIEVPENYPLRFIIHNSNGDGDVDAETKVVQRIFYGLRKGAEVDNDIVLTNDQRALEYKQLSSARRIASSNLPYDPENKGWKCNTKKYF